VPPIVSSVSPVRRSDIALINLGGLQNPFWPWKIPVAYAEAVISASRAVVPIDFPLEIATSESIAERLAVSDVGCRMTQEMPVLMSRSALMTPGSATFTKRPITSCRLSGCHPRRAATAAARQ